MEGQNVQQRNNQGQSSSKQAYQQPIGLPLQKRAQRQLTTFTCPTTTTL